MMIWEISRQALGRPQSLPHRMRLLDLFSGIGGFSLAAKWVWGDELEIEAFVEIDHFCQKVLKHRWPGVPIYDDIKEIQWVVADSTRNMSDRSFWEAEWPDRKRIRICFESPIDLLTAGWPCPPVSCAGKRKGTADDRWLWPEVIRTIREVKPRYCVLENVPGLLSIEDGMVFERVCLDLENEGYEVIPVIIPACAKGAPHRRDRVWIVGHNGAIKHPRKEQASSRKEGRRTNESCLSDHHAPDTDRTGLQRQRRLNQCSRETSITTNNFQIGNSRSLSSSAGLQSISYRGQWWQEYWYEVATRLCRVDDGVPSRVDRLKCLGNAIVPQVAEMIFRSIKEAIDGEAQIISDSQQGDLPDFATGIHSSKES